jgi:hypothetical protein
MRHATHPLSAALALLALAALPAPAAAGTPICLDTRLPGLDDPAAWRLWIVSEIARHPGHDPVDTDCPTTLTIEAFRVDGQLVLTAWFPGDVPLREEVAADTPVRPTLAELLIRVLGTEPLALANDTDRLVARLTDRRLPLSRGPTRLGLEVFQTVQRSVDRGTRSPSSMPGLAFRIGRESDRLVVGARVAASFRPSKPRAGDPTQAAAIVVVEPELAWFSSASATTAAYLGASLGLTIQHFVGHTPEIGEERITALGAALGLRVGVELFRASKLRVDLFTEASIPLHKTRSADSPLVDAWLPAVHLGAGVAF